MGGDALAGLMIGYVDNAFTEYEIPPFTTTQNYQTGGFIQDNWRVSNRLTLNMGLRYDVETPRTERYNQMSYFDPSAPSPISVPGLNLHGAVEYVGVNGNPRTEFNTYWGEVGPKKVWPTRSSATRGAARRLRECTTIPPEGRRRQCRLGRISRL